MTWKEAMRAALAGQEITRPALNGAWLVVVRDEDGPFLARRGGPIPWEGLPDDFQADDWEAHDVIEVAA